MKINKTIMLACIASFCTMTLVTGCSSDTIDETPGDSNDSNDETTYLDGYAHPDGVIILNQGARVSQNSTITYISPEGTIEENSYKKVNGTAFGNEAQDLYMYNGKIYLISNGIYSPNGEEGDGVLVIADAVTLKREKAYKMDELKFHRPEGSLDPEEMMPITTPLENIAVLDEQNIFFSDEQGVFRFDSTTGDLNIIEGSFHFGNQGNTVEGVASTRGIIRVGDHLYCGGGGFWETTRLIEFSKGMNKVNRVLPDLKGDFISGICQTGEREVMLATCGRGGEKKSYLYFVDLDKWEITKEKQIAEDISAEFFNTPGIALAGDYLYYAAGSTTVRRLSLSTWKAVDYIDTKQDAPDGEYLNCNVAVDPTNQYLYIAVSNAYSESEIPTKNYLLIYDCSGETSKLVKKIENQTCYPIGVFPMRKFYN